MPVAAAEISATRDEDYLIYDCRNGGWVDMRFPGNFTTVVAELNQIVEETKFPEPGRVLAVPEAKFDIFMKVITGLLKTDPFITRSKTEITKIFPFVSSYMFDDLKLTEFNYYRDDVIVSDNRMELLLSIIDKDNNYTVIMRITSRMDSNVSSDILITWQNVNTDELAEFGTHIKDIVSLFETHNSNIENQFLCKTMRDIRDIHKTIIVWLGCKQNETNYDHSDNDFSYAEHYSDGSPNDEFTDGPVDYASVVNNDVGDDVGNDPGNDPGNVLSDDLIDALTDAVQ